MSVSKWNWDLDAMILVIDMLAVLRKKADVHILGEK